MATYLVSSAGNGTDGTLAGGWANAHQTLAAAATAASTDLDIIFVDQSHQEAATAITVTFAASVFVICVDKDNSNALSTMVAGSGYIKANGTSNMTVSCPDGDSILFDGISIVHSGTGSRNIQFASSTAGYDGAFYFNNCYFGVENVGMTGQWLFGTSDRSNYTEFTNCTFTLADVSNTLRHSGDGYYKDCTFSLYSTEVPTRLFSNSLTDGAGTTIMMDGCDLSALTDVAIIDDTSGLSAATIVLAECKMPTGYSLINRVSATSRGGVKVTLLDCSTGDTHGIFGYGDMLGSAVTDSGIYYTSGSAAQSWKIVTTAYASKIAPFFMPWIDVYHSGTSSITPYFEVLRDGSATAYKHDEVWGEFFAKVTSGTTKASFKTNGCPSLGTGANLETGAGTGAWTGESGTAWSGKSYTGSGTSFTPAEAGYIRGRVGFAVASATLYVDPQIRGLA